MTDRPTRLHQRLYRVENWLGDRLDGTKLAWFWEWWPTEKLQGAVCRAYGHRPERDQCGIPDHDYCGWCQAPTPGQWRKTP